ncbi:hypothetical protein HDU93_000293, partial [Gonapodya sp. JEL0774]
VISSAIGNDPPPYFVVKWLFERMDRPPAGVFSHRRRDGITQEKPGEEIVVGKIEEGLVAFKELQRTWSQEIHGTPRVWGAKAGSGSGDKIGFRDEAHLKRIGKNKLLRHRNWCEITELPSLSYPNPTTSEGSDANFVPQELTPTLPSRLEFIIHVERAREAKLVRTKLKMKLDPRGWEKQMQDLREKRLRRGGNEWPETNEYGLVVPGLVGWGKDQRVNHRGGGQELGHPAQPQDRGGDFRDAKRFANSSF